jgi:hypothetical protein
MQNDAGCSDGLQRLEVIRKLNAKSGWITSDLYRLLFNTSQAPQALPVQCIKWCDLPEVSSSVIVEWLRPVSCTYRLRFWKEGVGVWSVCRTRVMPLMIDSNSGF